MNRRMKAHNDLKDATLLNSATYFDYLQRFKKLATSMFEWENLPESMDARYLETCLYYLGSASLLYDEEYGFMNARAITDGSINIYGLPSSIQCTSFQYEKHRKTYMGYNEKNDKKDDEAILVMNTFDRIDTASTLELFAKRLANAERTIDVNIAQQKMPRMILTNDAQQFTARNLVQKIDNNEYYIFGDKNLMSSDQIKAIKTDAPYVADKLLEYKTYIWNEVLTFLGINNIEEKKERLIQTEGDAKNELINLNLQSFLAPRELACKQFNEKFGKNISVKVRSDLHNMIKEMKSIASDYNNLIKEGENE